MVALISGGTGGAKLARGLIDVADELTVVANTADDVEIYGVHVSPDPDLIAYWLADLIDERGYGIAGDSWGFMDGLEAAGLPAWFRLGDRDLAMCLVRTELLRAGRRLTEAHAAVVDALGVGARVLPMCDEPVTTEIVANGRQLPFQEFMIVERAEGPLDGVALRGIEAAQPTQEVRSALAAADVIVIGPSNPVISIGPVLLVPGMWEAIASSPAPVVAVSPFVGGRAVKGPTEMFCAFAGIEAGAAGLARAYEGLIDGIVADEPVDGLPALVTPTLMRDAETRRALGQSVLQFGRSLG